MSLLQLPAVRPHKKLLLRLVVAIRRRADNAVCLLVSEKTAVHLPVCELNPTRSIHATLKKYMSEIFGGVGVGGGGGSDGGGGLPPHRPHGLLSAEHSGKPSTSNDGVCLTLLVSVRVPLEEVSLIDKYAWLQLDKKLGENILSRMGKNMVLPLTVIR